MRRQLLLMLLSGALVLGRVAAFRPPVAAPPPIIIRGIPSLPPSFAPAAPAAASRDLGGGVHTGVFTIRRRLSFNQPALASSSLATHRPSDNDMGAVEAMAGAMEEDERQQAVPSLAALLRFTIPTLGIWLAGPIMSLVRVCREAGMAARG